VVIVISRVMWGSWILYPYNEEVAICNASCCLLFSTHMELRLTAVTKNCEVFT